MIEEKFEYIKIISYIVTTITFIFTAFTANANNDIIIKDGILHINGFDKGKYESTCHVKILIDYNIIVDSRYKSDSTSYDINISNGKYFKYGGFEYNENGKTMHYESQHTLSYRDDLIDRPDSWPSVKDDYIAGEIYNYLKINNILCE